MSHDTLTLRPYLVTAATFPPLTTSEAKRHCDLPSADATHDEYLAALITAASEKFERDTGRTVCSSTWRERFDQWPDDELELHKLPIQSITTLQYVDTNGTTQTWSSSNYSLDLGRGMPTIIRAYDVDWPSARDQRNAITVTYVAGYATPAAIPPTWKQAMLLLIGHWFDNRALSVVGQWVAESPEAYKALVDAWRMPTYP